MILTHKRRNQAPRALSLFLSLSFAFHHFLPISPADAGRKTIFEDENRTGFFEANFLEANLEANLKISFTGSVEWIYKSLTSIFIQ